VEKLSEMYRLWALSKGASVRPWLDLLGDEIRFRSLGAAAPEVAFSQDGVSRADVERYFRELNRDWEMVHYDVEQMISEGDNVAVIARCGWRNRATGKVAETLKADFFRFEGGLVVEFTEFFDTAGAAAAARP
jgi:ketosteroid isomerase-like protein